MRKHIYNASLFLCSCLFATGLFSCKGSAKKADGIRGVSVTFNMDLGASYKVNDFYDVYYFKDLTAFRQPYSFDSIVNGNLVQSKEYYKYFVIEKDSTFGLWYDLSKHMFKEPTRDALDSVLAHMSHDNGTYNTLSEKKPDSSYRDSNGDLVKVYYDTASSASRSKGKIYFYYSSSLVGIRESLSGKMDNEDKLKLYRISTDVSETFVDSLQQKIPAGTVLLEIKQITSTPKEVENIFSNYILHQVKR